MKSVSAFLFTFISLLSLVSANWESVTLSYGDEKAFDQEFLDFISSQKHVKHIIDDTLAQPQMKFYKEGSTDAAETLFVTYVPIGMVKDIMKEKGLLKSLTSDDL